MIELGTISNKQWSELRVNKYHGQCLCGGIKYEVDAIGPKMGHCHCTMCRRFHGAAFATFGEARVEDFHWLQGEDLLKVFTADNQTKRKFCVNCGSSLIFESAGDHQGTVEFSLGSLDAAPNLRPDAHIYTDAQVEWFDANDGLPRHTRGRTET